MKNKNFQKFSDHSEIFFCFSIHKKLNQSCFLDKIFLFLKKNLVSLKKNTFEILCSGTQCGGFQFMLILDLWGISFHPAVVVGLGNDLLFNSILAHCVTQPFSRPLVWWDYSRSLALSSSEIAEANSRSNFFLHKAGPTLSD